MAVEKKQQQEKKQFPRPLRRATKRRPESTLQKVREEVAQLFFEAELFFDEGDKVLARRRVRQARRKAMKVQLPIPQHAEQYCRKCDAFLKVGTNASVRIRNKVRIRRCGECGAVRRKIIS